MTQDSLKPSVENDQRLMANLLLVDIVKSPYEDR